MSFVSARSLRVGVAVYLFVMCQPLWATGFCRTAMEVVGAADDLVSFILGGADFKKYDGQVVQLSCSNCASLGQTVSVSESPPPFVARILSLSTDPTYLNRAKTVLAQKVWADHHYDRGTAPLYLDGPVDPRVVKKVTSHNLKFSARVGKVDHVEIGGWEVTYEDGHKIYGTFSDYGGHNIQGEVYLKALDGLIGSGPASPISNVTFYHVHPDVPSVSMKDQIAMLGVQRRLAESGFPHVAVKWVAIHPLDEGVITTTISTN